MPAPFRAETKAFAPTQHRCILDAQSPAEGPRRWPTQPTAASPRSEPGQPSCVGPGPVSSMPTSIPAIRYADRHTTALLARLRLDARRFDVVFAALAAAFDAGAAPTVSPAPDGPRAPLDGPAVASPRGGG